MIEMRLNMRIIIQSLIIMLFIPSFYGCTSSINTNVDEGILPILKKFQQIISNHEIEGKGYNYIVASNFNMLFNFIDEKDRREIFELFEEKKIVRIEVWDKKCILFKIRPDFNNSITKETWEELYIAYYDNCDCVCHRKINEMDVSKEKISTIQDKWYKIIAINKRYIGG